MSLMQRVKSIASALLMIAAAVAMLLFPDNGFGFIALILSVSLTLYGMRTLVYYFSMARHMVGGKLQLYKGIILLDIGMFFMSLDNVPIFYLMLYLLVANLISGVIEILGAREARQMEAGSW